MGFVAEGKPIKAIAVARGVTPEAIDAEVEAVFLKLAQGASSGNQLALSRLRSLHLAIVDREEQGETLSRLLPGGLAEKVRREGQQLGVTERVEVTVVMSDIRAYSGIAEHADPTQLAGQLNTHRAAMNDAILGEGGTVMQFVGDAVMAVFGAPVAQADHADRAVAAAAAMHAKPARDQRGVGRRGAARLRARHRAVVRPGGRGAARLRGAARVHARRRHREPPQRLQQFAAAGETVLSEATLDGLRAALATVALGAQMVKGRDTPVVAYKVIADGRGRRSRGAP